MIYKMENVSRYKNNSVASKKKHIYSRLLDYFSTFVVSYLLFTIVYAVGVRLPPYSKASTKYNEIALNAARYIGETHLESFDEETKTLSTISEDATQYLISLTKTSAYVHDLTYPVKQSDGTYVETVVTKEETFVYNALEYPKDNLSYYFKKFKKIEPSLNDYTYDEVDYKDDIDTYLYIKIMNINPEYFVSKDDPALLAKGEGVSNFVVLTLENTNKMINRIAKEETIDSAAVELYNKLYGGYGNSIQYGIDEVQGKSAVYIEFLNQFNVAYQEVAKHLFIMFLIAYTLAFILLVVVLRIISKEWVTIGQKVMNLSICSTKEMEVGPVQLTFYHLINYLLFSTSSLIGFFLMGMFGVFSLQVFPHINLLAIMLFLLTFELISLFFPFFNRNGHDLASVATRILVKDKGEYDAPIEEVVDVEFETREEDGK